MTEKDLTGGFKTFAPWVKRFGLTHEYGTCQCGCGKKVNRARSTDAKKGYLQGHPIRYVKGHQDRRRNY